ncbi:Crp/Fnr family transcriptional regulator [Roseovarius sp. EL26]|uniref:Crp/Fnr family transcriptional regulator n=1 Tax=Roseovarius sp. EL26 TaxID=2126672 RepID=UPI000EA07DC0|nr:Crp/Fnr family transcriptional regulator [Roseovarius sp. EL26]
MEDSRWLQALDTSTAQRILKEVTKIEFERSQNIYAIGDQNRELYGLIKGVVGVQIDHSEAGLALGHIFGPGDWFGEAAVITGTARLIGTIALTDCELFRITETGLHSILRELPDFWRALGVLSALNGALAIQVSRDLLIANTRERCLTILKRLANSSGRPRAIPLTQEQLAEACRVSRSGFAKLLSELEEEGYVRRKYGHVALVQNNKDDQAKH